MRSFSSVLMAFCILASSYLCLDGFFGRAESATPGEPARPLSVFNVRDFGALGDSKTKDTGAIQKAIDAASRAGGGTVYFPPGSYLSGTVYLKDHVTLYLEEGSVLLGSTEIADFPKNVPGFRSYTDSYVTQSLIYGENLHDIAITGRGTIDGQGAAFLWKDYGNRPYIIRFITCRDILVQGITLTNSPMWMQHYLACDFVTIQGIKVDNHCTYNNDMLDIDCCHNVHISDCTGSSDDDALTLKSTSDRACENVTITNCILASHCNAIKMGTESNGGFKNITISNCAINSQFKEKGYYGGIKGSSGISLEIVDGGTMENVTVSNITIKGVSVPLFLRLGNRARPFRKDMEKPGMGAMRNVVISNITATNVEKTGCSITGLPGHPVRNVTLSDIRITFPGGGTEQEAAREVPEHEDKYPEASMFGTLPAWGFYCRHVEGLRMSNIDLQAEEADYRPALVCDDVRALEVSGFSTAQAAAGSPQPMIVLRDVQGAGIRASSPAASQGAFLRLEGKTARVSAIGNDLSRVLKKFEFGEGVSEAVLFEAANRGGE